MKESRRSAVVERSDKKKRRIFLVGFMGAGKTSVGRVLARRLGWSFRDLDDVIEALAGRTISEIFAEDGEAGFRGMETAALEGVLRELELLSESGAVIALGGGAFIARENREALRRAGGMTVFLQAPMEELRRRCTMQSGARPLAADVQKFAQLYAARYETYALSPWKVETMDKTVEEVAAEIEQLISTIGKTEVQQ